MKHSMVLALTRYGDLIQATPLLRSLKKNGHRTTLVLQSSFGDIQQLLPYVDRFVEFPQGLIASQIGSGEDVTSAYATLQQFLQDAGPCDHLINLSCNRMSGFLTALIPHKSCSGLCYSEMGDRQITGAWARYLFNVILGDNRKANQISLVDIFTRMGEVIPDGLPVELKTTAAGEAKSCELLPESEKPYIGLQMGASEQDRCWPVASFAALARLLEDNGYHVVLLGAKGEQRLADQFLGLNSCQPVNLIGRTDIPTLYSSLKKLTALVTNDTGTMHFAAAAGTRILMLATGPAHPECTGPYCAEARALVPDLPCAPCHYNTECASPICRDAVSVENAFGALQDLIAGLPARQFNGTRQLVSSYDEEGYQVWLGPLWNGTGLVSAREWRQLLDGTSLGAERARDNKGLARFALLVSQGSSCCKEMTRQFEKKALNVARLKDLAADEERIMAEIKQLGIIAPGLAPLCDYLTLAREDAVSDDPGTMAQMAYKAYRAMSRWLPATH